MEKLKLKIKKIGARLCKAAIFLQCLSYSMLVNAQTSENFAANGAGGGGSSLENTTLVQGLLNLAADAGKVLLVVELGVIGVLEVAIGLKYQFGEEDEKPKHKKNAKTTLVVGALILSASGVITVVLSYFQ